MPKWHTTHAVGITMPVARLLRHVLFESERRQRVIDDIAGNVFDGRLIPAGGGNMQLVEVIGNTPAWTADDTEAGIQAGIP